MVDVARVAGVSHVTVSRVLNGHPSVRPETRDRVNAAIQLLGYRRNSVARALKTRRSTTLGVVLAGSMLYELPQILLGIETTARDAGYSLDLASRQTGSPEDLQETFQRLTDLGVTGIIVIASRAAGVAALEPLATSIPVTVIMSGDVKNPALGFVEIDQVMGGRLAARHLLDLGHRRLATIAGPASTHDAQARAAGWGEELSRQEIAVDLLHGDFSPQSGYALAQTMIDRPGELPTAIFMGNDHMAMGALAAFAAAGIRVPTDVSLVGFDNITGTDFLVPALTTVGQDYFELGSSAVRSVLSGVPEGDDPVVFGQTPSHIKIPASLIVRASTGPPRTSSSRDR